MKEAIQTLIDELAVTRASIFHADKSKKHFYQIKEKEILRAIEILNKSERQSSTEVSEQTDSKALHIADVSKRFCELSYDIAECGKHGDYITGCLECKHFK